MLYEHVDWAGQDQTVWSTVGVFVCVTAGVYNIVALGLFTAWEVCADGIRQYRIHGS